MHRGGTVAFTIYPHTKGFWSHFHVSEMKQLLIGRQVLSWLCALPTFESAPKSKKRAFIAFAATIFILNFIGILSTVAYFQKYVSIDFEIAMCAVYLISAMINSTYGCVYLFCSRHKINDILDNWSNILNTCKSRKWNTKECWQWLDIYYTFDNN